MSLKHDSNSLGEKDGHNVPKYESGVLGQPTRDPEDHSVVIAGENVLHRDLKGRHMQMIAMWV